MEHENTITVDILEKSGRGLGEPRYDVALKFSTRLVLAYKLSHVGIIDEFVSQLRRYGQVEVMDDV
jgi:hypothetical protein